MPPTILSHKNSSVATVSKQGTFLSETIVGKINNFSCANYTVSCYVSIFCFFLTTSNVFHQILGLCFLNIVLLYLYHVQSFYIFSQFSKAGAVPGKGHKFWAFGQNLHIHFSTHCACSQELGKQVPYARHYNPLLIRNRS